MVSFQPAFSADLKTKNVMAKKFKQEEIKKMSETKAVIETKFGSVTLKFFPDVAPNHVNNFIELAKKGFYDGLAFHRVVPGFVTQGGDPNGDGSGGPGYTIKGEFTENGVNNPQKHVKYAVAMARTNVPDSAGSQFYICLDAQPALDGKYAVFGQVVKAAPPRLMQAALKFSF